MFLGNLLVSLAAFALFIVLIAILAILASAMQGIFVVALYTYARTGEVPGDFNRNLVTGAFAPSSSGQFAPGNI